MSEFIKMDIFFAITSVVMVILGILMIILLVYAIKFLKNIKYISDKARKGTDSLGQMFSFFGSTINRKKKGK